MTNVQKIVGALVVVAVGVGGFFIIKKIKANKQLDNGTASSGTSSSTSSGGSTGTSIVFPLKYGNSAYNSGVYQLQVKLNAYLDNMYKNGSESTKKSLISTIGNGKDTYLLVTDGLYGEKTRKALVIKFGGVATSQHLTGEAADLECSDKAKLFNLIRNNLPFDQLIWENGTDAQPAWVHVSYTDKRALRKEVLRLKNGSYYKI